MTKKLNNKVPQCCHKNKSKAQKFAVPQRVSFISCKKALADPNKAQCFFRKSDENFFGRNLCHFIFILRKKLSIAHSLIQFFCFSSVKM